MISLVEYAMLFLLLLSSFPLLFYLVQYVIESNNYLKSFKMYNSVIFV